jgi:hypothetical protein
MFVGADSCLPFWTSRKLAGPTDLPELERRRGLFGHSARVGSTQGPLRGKHGTSGNYATGDLERCADARPIWRALVGRDAAGPPPGSLVRAGSDRGSLDGHDQRSRVSGAQQVVMELCVSG